MRCRNCGREIKEFPFDDGNQTYWYTTNDYYHSDDGHKACDSIMILSSMSPDYSKIAMPVDFRTYSKLL